MTLKPRIAIIGAGITGLRLATELSASADVSIFEKSRGYGGRMSTRRAEAYQFDHGAQYFTARGPKFRAFLAPFVQSGIVAEWTPRLAVLDKHTSSEKTWNSTRYVAVPGMNALCRAIAEPLTVHRETRVAEIKRSPTGWVLASNKGEDLGGFDWVISAAPAEQTRDLLPSEFEAMDVLERTKMQGCFSLMAGLHQQIDPGWDAAQVRGNSPLSWIALNQSKPGRSPAASVLCQSRGDWAETHMERDQAEVQDVMLAALGDATGVTAKDCAYIALHRWRFAGLEKPASEPYLIDEKNHLAAAGDWCGTGRVESGFDSANALLDVLENAL